LQIWSYEWLKSTLASCWSALISHVYVNLTPRFA
jgi:hypothetical protein